jgi:hypothetical protein
MMTVVTYQAKNIRFYGLPSLLLQETAPCSHVTESPFVSQRIHQSQKKRFLPFLEVKENCMCVCECVCECVCVCLCVCVPVFKLAFREKYEELF